MMTICRLWMVTGLLGVASAFGAHAQSNDQYYQEQQQQQRQAHDAEQARQGYQNQIDADQSQAPLPPPQPSGQWKTTWGAIAVDSVTGNAGTVTGLSSKREAINVALERCSNGVGAKGCKVITSYANQCAAAAYGNGRVTAIGGPTIKDAENSAMSGCAEGGDDCKIVYSDCSKPQFVRY